ncbi:MAG: hypothetical protein ACOZAK_03095 [Patescibacteria group bacterium]
MRKKKARKANEPNQSKISSNNNPGILPQFKQKINQRNFRAASIFMPRRPK